MRRVCRNGNHVALGQVMGLPAFNFRGSPLVGGGLLGANHGAASHERCLPLDDDEQVISLQVKLRFTCFPAIRQDPQTGILDDCSALGHCG